MKIILLAILTLSFIGCLKNKDFSKKNQDVTKQKEVINPKLKFNLHDNSSPLGLGFYEVYSKAYNDLKGVNESPKVNQEQFANNQKKFKTFYQGLYSLSKCLEKENGKDCSNLKASINAKSILKNVDDSIDQNKRDPYKNEKEYFYLDLSNLRDEVIKN